jgi:hypothetical protein
MNIPHWIPWKPEEFSSSFPVPGRAPYSVTTSVRDGHCSCQLQNTQHLRMKWYAKWNAVLRSTHKQETLERLKNSTSKMAASATGIIDRVISVTKVVWRHGNDAVADDSCGSGGNGGMDGRRELWLDWISSIRVWKWSNCDEEVVGSTRLLKNWQELLTEDRQVSGYKKTNTNL